MQLLVAWTALRTLAALGRLEPVDEAREGIKVDAAPAAIVETHWPETGIRTRPWAPSKRIATMSKGTRLVVRGQIASRDSSGCKGKPWYAVYPFGYVCSEHVKPARDQPTVGHALADRMRGERRLPFDYTKVREDGALMYRGVDGVRTGVAARSLSEGMNLAVARTLEVDGGAYVETVDGALVSKSAVGWLGQGSAWRGVFLAGDAGVGPAFAWSSRDKTPVLAEPDLKAAQVGTLGLRERVDLLEESGEADPARWWKIGEGRWVQAKNLNEVVFTPIPEGALRDNRLASGDDQWIDIDLGEQVLVAYRGARPVYVTLVSSGKGSPTPKGNYPIWAKVASMTMANQDYEDNPYMVEHVPWVMLFQGHNALHGAYWHDQFGKRRSHGCVNLAPLDARWLFEWVAPALPAGWTGYLPADLERSVVVHVRDSSLPPDQAFFQERPIGPPDPEEEKRRLEEADERRAEAAAATADFVPAAAAGG
ncbi:L,D-transpeptidase [Nannocystis bainbridge]|uniref:L,D-transpeptidase family protein n=1 Tax=Nannocystis bainbridge TaxID=2995303 RepID=A0ABT5EAN0_9BACT|nr:L,D-transpeptidase family protein [Nannocystis bainbridge]MDC0722916.1 L,D-transpeptidase family protein [Nannocystis bainbridge]